MKRQGFVATHATDAKFERGLRSFFEYRDLGIKTATHGRLDAHVIRAASGSEFSSQPHRHHTDFQLVYNLQGWSSSTTRPGCRAAGAAGRVHNARCPSPTHAA